MFRYRLPQEDVPKARVEFVNLMWSTTGPNRSSSRLPRAWPSKVDNCLSSFISIEVGVGPGVAILLDSQRCLVHKKGSDEWQICR